MKIAKCPMPHSKGTVVCAPYYYEGDPDELYPKNRRWQVECVNCRFSVGAYGSERGAIRSHNRITKQIAKDAGTMKEGR